MIREFRQISRDQWFLLLIFVLALFLAFLFGYVVSAYIDIELSKSVMKFGDISKYKFE